MKSAAIEVRGEEGGDGAAAAPGGGTRSWG